MDAFKLLARSSKLSKNRREQSLSSAPSNGQTLQPQLFREGDELRPSGLRKRKRGQDDVLDSGVPAPVDGAVFENETGRGHGSRVTHPSAPRAVRNSEQHGVSAGTQGGSHTSLEQRKSILKRHKVKVTLLSPQSSRKASKTTQHGVVKASKAKNALYPEPLHSLQDLRSRHGLSNRLATNIADQGYAVPTEVQLAALPLLLDNPNRYLGELEATSIKHAGDATQIDLLTVAPTGSGKTLAFMIPLVDAVLRKRGKEASRGQTTSAIVLAPTKELASQITNEGRKLVKGTGVSIAQMRKGMKLAKADIDSLDDDSKSDSESEAEKDGPEVKADIVVSTPGLLQSAMAESESMSRCIDHLVLDEADVLLDPLFREQTLVVWNKLGSSSLQVSFWSATMGSNIEELVVSTIEGRRARLRGQGSQPVDAPIVRLVVGLKDSAVPNVQHRLTYAATERGKLMGIRQLLHPVSTSAGPNASLRPPFLVFTQTIERAIALHSELMYDIPAEAGGATRIAVLHSDLSDAKREDIMTRFRKGEVWILITTDLLSRGVDFRGVNGVVNYDIPNSSAAYVHRIGRTGRAGRDGGVAVTLYSKEDIPYLKHVVNVVTMAEKQKGVTSEVPQWLLDSLPKLGKNAKKDLKKRGIQAKTSRGQRDDPKAARKLRISSKAGFVRREENKRKGAVLGSQRRQEAAAQSDSDNGSHFGGFD